MQGVCANVITHFGGVFYILANVDSVYAIIKQFQGPVLYKNIKYPQCTDSVVS